MLLECQIRSTQAVDSNNLYQTALQLHSINYEKCRALGSKRIDVSVKLVAALEKEISSFSWRNLVIT
jgi:hypothetical protein